MSKFLKQLFKGPDVDEKFKIETSTKVKFAIGNFGFNLSSGLQAAWLMNVWIKIFHIHPFAWGLAWILYFVWNSINDPLVGYLSDKTRTRFGRRMPWLMVSVPLLTTGFILLFLPPKLDPTIGVNQWFLFIWLFITLMIYDTAYTIYGLCSGALISELTIQPEERAHMNFFAVIVLSLSVAITFVVPFLLIDTTIPYDENLPVIQSLVLIFGFVGMGCVAVTAFGIKERQEFYYNPYFLSNTSHYR